MAYRNRTVSSQGRNEPPRNRECPFRGQFGPAKRFRACQATTPLPRSSGGPGAGGREVRFGVHVRNDNRDGTPPLVRLKALCGPGDAGEPVISVLLPNEGASCHDVG